MDHRDHVTTLRYSDHAPTPPAARSAQRAFAADSGNIAAPASAPAAPPDIVASVTENEREAPTAPIPADPPRPVGASGEERASSPDRFAPMLRAADAGLSPNDYRTISARMRDVRP